MKGLSSIRRSVVDSPLIGVLLAAGLATALGGLLAPAHSQSFEKRSANLVAPPATSLPLFVRASQEPKAVRASFQSHAPADRSALPTPAPPRVEKKLSDDRQRRIAWREFDPLYCRPPPNCS